MLSDIEKKNLKRFSLLIFAISIVFALIIGFFVAFYLRNLSRLTITLAAGLFMGTTLGFATYTVGLLLFIFTGLSHKRAIIFTVVFPLCTVIFGILAELFIFRMGGTHYYWVAGSAAAAVFVGIALEMHEKLKELIINSLGTLEKTYHQVVQSLNKSLEIIEPYNKGHCERVAWYSLCIANKLGLNEDSRQRIVRAALLHDLGKIGISEKILLKESELDFDEWEIMRSHPGVAAKILNPLRRNFSREISIIHYHHERTDGQGYRGIPADEIPRESMIIAVAEAYDTMITEKPYGHPLSGREALDELKKSVGTQFNEEIVKAFIEIVEGSPDFHRPSHEEIRKELNLEDLGEELSLDADSPEEIGRITRNISLLRKFYQLMGEKKNKLLSHLYTGLGVGTLLGVTVGFSVYSLSRDPLQIVSFILQGLITGGVIFLVGPTLDYLLAPKSDSAISFWKTTAGKAVMFFPAGVAGGVISLILVYFRFQPDAPGGITLWNAAYILFAGLLSSGTSYLSYLSRRTASILLDNLKNLQSLYFELIYSLSFALEAKDPYTRGHTERVARYCELLSDQFDLNENEKEDLKLAAFFHDIGKIGVQLAVLNKNSSLEKHEFDIIRQHPETGADMIESIGLFVRLAPYIRHHHEHWDGSGYPGGLKGEKIPLLSRIIAVADAYDALITDRPYKEGFTREKAISILKEESGKNYDPIVVEKFIRKLEEMNQEDFGKQKIYPDLT